MWKAAMFFVQLVKLASCKTVHVNWCADVNGICVPIFFFLKKVVLNIFDLKVTTSEQTTRVHASWWLNFICIYCLWESVVCCLAAGTCDMNPEAPVAFDQMSVKIVPSLWGTVCTEKRSICVWEFVFPDLFAVLLQFDLWRCLFVPPCVSLTFRFVWCLAGLCVWSVSVICVVPWSAVCVECQVCVMPCRAVCVERVSHLCGTLICCVCVCGVSGLCDALPGCVCGACQSFVWYLDLLCVCVWSVRFVWCLHLSCVRFFVIPLPVVCGVCQSGLCDALTCCLWSVSVRFVWCLDLLCVECVSQVCVTPWTVVGGASGLCDASASCVWSVLSQVCVMPPPVVCGVSWVCVMLSPAVCGVSWVCVMLSPVVCGVSWVCVMLSPAVCGVSRVCVMLSPAVWLWSVGCDHECLCECICKGGLKREWNGEGGGGGRSLKCEWWNKWRGVGGGIKM